MRSSDSEKLKRESEIIDMFFRRDPAALKSVSDDYGRLFRRIAFNITSSDTVADEVANDVLLALWNAIPPAQPTNLTAFVAGVARNQSLKRLSHLTSKKRSAGTLVPLEELAEILPDERFAPDADDGEVSRLISSFLRAQTADVRNVFLRRYYFFDSVAEIAKRYSFTESKVKNLLFRTRNKLKDYLTKEGITI